MIKSIYLLNVVLKKIVLIVLLTVSAAVFVNAENIRGNTAGFLDTGSPGVNFKPEELVILDIHNDVPEFQKGVELQISIPKELKKFPNSFAILIYSRITPEPSSGIKSYRGTRLYMRLMPSMDSVFIKIPLKDNEKFSADAYTDISPKASFPSDFPLILTILPVIKGLPDYVFNTDFAVKAVPLWSDKGTITVNIKNPSNNPEETISMTIDGVENKLGTAVTVSSGMHRIRVASSLAQIVEKTIVIEPGGEKTLNITLDYQPPVLNFSIPENTVMFFDGKQIENTGGSAVMETEPGNHTISYTLGDYTITRDFMVLPGSKLKINLIVDIEIMEYGESSGNDFGAGNGP